MGAAEIKSAIVALCQAPNDAAFATLHEGLAQDQPLVAEVHRNRLLLDAPRVDLTNPSASDALDKAAASTPCQPSWARLGRAILTSAEALAENHHPVEALARCGDVFAMARDANLVGNLMDTLFANTDIQLAVMHCVPIVDAAPTDARAAFATSLAALRVSFPATLDDVLRRDRADTMLFTFGRLRDPAKAPACDRAKELVAAQGPMPEKRADRVELVRAWNEAKLAPQRPDPKYQEAYMLTLATLDKLITRARSR